MNTVSERQRASSQDEMDAALKVLASSKDSWAAASIPDRMAILDELIKDTAAVGEQWVESCLAAKAVRPDDASGWEEWAAGPYALVRNLALLKRALAGIASYGRPKIPGPVFVRRDGQVVAQVFPETIYDRLFFHGMTMEVWMQPGVTPETLPHTQALAYQNGACGSVALVLGAGNYLSIGVMDSLHKLFVELQVVLLKLSPMHSHLGTLIERSCRALIERGLLRLASGGEVEGAYLCSHPSVDEIHITGTRKTFDTIVFGPGEDGSKRKVEGRPVLTKRITGELGNVSPVIIVPGPWRSDNLDYQAEHLVTMLTHNAGCNCGAAQVMIQHAAWPMRLRLLERVKAMLAMVPLRTAFYPGMEERHRRFVDAHPEIDLFGESSASRLPWGVIGRLDAGKLDDICFTTEAFCGILAETALESATIPEYLDRAVKFANEGLLGTLCANLIVHPGSLADPEVAAALDRAIGNLRYGTVAVNCWAAASYISALAPWGAFPGHGIQDIQSGAGVVHNTLMFSRSQKTVVRAPFRMKPTPVWFATRGKAARKVFAKLISLEAHPSVWKIPGVIWAATGYV